MKAKQVVWFYIPWFIHSVCTDLFLYPISKFESVAYLEFKERHRKVWSRLQQKCN